MHYLNPRTAIAVLAGAALSAPALAHIYTQFPPFDRGGLYQQSRKEGWPIYEDGAFGPVRFNIQHACTHEEFSNVTTKQVVLVVPTGSDLQKISTVLPAPWDFPNFDPPYQELGKASPDANGYEWGINWIKPVTHPSFPKAHNVMGTTSGGGKVPRAIVWVGDHPDGNDADVTATVEFPEIPAGSCVKEVQYFFPVAQFCGNAKPDEAVLGWLLGTTDTWAKRRLGETEVQWTPALSMRRNLKTKPLDAKCGAGETIAIYPSKTDIDTYLRPAEVDANGQVTLKSIRWWVNQNAK